MSTTKTKGPLVLSMFAVVVLGSLGLLAAMSGSSTTMASTPHDLEPVTASTSSSSTASELSASAPELMPAKTDTLARTNEAERPTAPRPTSAEREAVLVSKLRASGTASGRWSEDAHQVIAKWRAAGGAAAKARFGEFECHRDGCMAEATYPDEIAFELADESLTESEAFKAFPGWRHRSFRKDDTGQIVATWFLMNPSDAR
jgi:hypothetical protein